MQNLTVSTKALAVIKMITATVQKSATGVSFVSIKNYTNTKGEVSNNLINIGIKYDNAKKKDIEFLETLPQHIKQYEFKSPADLIETARRELITSFTKPDKVRSEAQIDAYEHIVPGLKVHKETGVLYLYGYREKKEVIKKGEYKEVNSAPLTIAKDEIRKHLRTGKFTQFALEIGTDIKANGETLEL